jgi:hypothetical protein
MMRAALCLALLVAGCTAGRGGTPADGSAGDRANLTNGDGSSAQPGCSGAEFVGCYTVYAHANHVLYHVDLAKKMLITVGPFNAPKVGGAEDVITDLAVAPDDTVYVVSKTNLYTADPKDGHVTLVGPVTACGSDNVALTTTPDGNLYAGDFQGAFCKIDLSAHPPKVTQIGTIGGGLALSGDMVAVADGTVYGTAYKLADATTQKDNLLIKIDPATGKGTQVLGATGFPDLFGVAFSMGQVFAFTHDGSGTVVTIDPKTGVGTPYNTFKDPTTGQGIAFAGAGVNSMVAPPIM